MSGKEESMPRKSKDRVARWGTHQEAKDDRRRGRSKSKQKWRKEMEKETMANNEIKMTKLQMQAWVGRHCKFAVADGVDKLADAVVGRIVKATKKISAEQFANIVVAVLTKIAYVPIPTKMQDFIKKDILTKLKGLKPANEAALRKAIIQSLTGPKGLVRQFNYDPNGLVLKTIIDNVVEGIFPRGTISDRPEGTYPERKQQEGGEAQRYMDQGGPRIHFPPPKR